MATKKQKRAAALAKREAFMGELKERGLEAQIEGHIQEETVRAQIRAEVEAVNARHHSILENATPEDWANARKSIEGRY